MHICMWNLCVCPQMQVEAKTCIVYLLWPLFLPPLFAVRKQLKHIYLSSHLVDLLKLPHNSCSLLLCSLPIHPLWCFYYGIQVLSQAPVAVLESLLALLFLHDNIIPPNLYRYRFCFIADAGPSLWPGMNLLCSKSECLLQVRSCCWNITPHLIQPLHYCKSIAHTSRNSSS